MSYKLLAWSGGTTYWLIRKILPATLRPATRYFQPSTPPIITFSSRKPSLDRHLLCLLATLKANNGSSPATHRLRLYTNLRRHHSPPFCVDLHTRSSNHLPYSPSAQRRSRDSKNKHHQSLCFIWQHRSSFLFQLPRRSAVTSTARTCAILSTKWPAIVLSKYETYRLRPYPHSIIEH